MKFGPTPVEDAVGDILAHGTRHATGTFKKGRVLTQADVEALREAGVSEVIAARLSADDVPEDKAARQISIAAAGPNIRLQEAFTGRANLYAEAPGVAVIDEVRVKAVNHLHEGLTLATLQPYARATARQMLATIKVIPFALPQHVLADALAIIGNEPLVSLASFKPLKAALVLTRLPQTKAQILAKSETVMRDRLAELGAQLGNVLIVDHTEAAISAAINATAQDHDIVFVMGASAIVDRMDVVPAGLTRAGGTVRHLGMPVDPGNLLMFGHLGNVPVIGVPSCARSPKVNGFDWVLERVVAGLDVTSRDIMDMGVGGLLAEIPSRPVPREGTTSQARVTAVVLAAGLSSRLGSNKLLAKFRGQTVLGATLASIRASGVDDFVVVTGRDVEAVTEIAGKTRTVHNADFASGIASSIRVGVEAAGDADAVLICLGDMPLVQPATINKLIAAFNSTEGRTIVSPQHHGQFGNPVLWGREHFSRLVALQGDKGARALFAELKSDVVEIAVDDSGVLADVDTKEDLKQLS